MRCLAALFALGLFACSSSGLSGTSTDAGPDVQASDSGADGQADDSGNGCRGQGDCGSGWFCAVYTLPPLCGGQYDSTFDNDCQADGDCADAGAGFICDNRLCVFPHGGAQVPDHCRRGCDVAVDCGPGFDCNAHHCEPASCATSSCGPDFTCQGGVCAAKSCTHDSDCNGYCVNGACSATLGVCEQAVP